MKKNYVIPAIRIQEIDTNESILDTPMSIPFYKDNEDEISESSEILVNNNSIWDIEN